MMAESKEGTCKLCGDFHDINQEGYCVDDCFRCEVAREDNELHGCSYDQMLGWADDERKRRKENS
jgi:hypothetical protein